MKEESLIYVRLEHQEAVDSKRDLLYSEMNLIRIMKRIRKYQSLRIEELKIKTKLKKNIREIKLNIKNIQTILPKIKIPEILKKDQTQESEIPQIKTKTISTDLESELKDIQEKLKSLQA